MEMKKTHYGSMFGVPVYLDMTDPECPAVEARFKLDFLLDFMQFLFDMYCMARSSVDIEFEPMFPIKVMGEVEQDRS